MNATVSESEAVEISPGLPRAWTTQLTAVLEMLIAIVTLVGNIVFIGVFTLKKKLRTLANAFLVNLSLTDIVAAIFVSSFSVDLHFRRGWIFGRNMCVLHNILHPALMSTSLLLAACIAINRYVYIAHHNVYPRITNKLTVTLGILFSWGFPLAFHVVNVPKHSKYSPSVFRCRAYVNELDSALTLYIPSLATVIFYVLIFFAVRKSRCRVQAYPGHISGTQPGPNAQEVRMLKILLVVFFMITFGYLPYVIIANTYMWLRIPPPAEVYIIIYPGLHIAGCLNPILYGACNKNFRVACIELLTGKLFRGNDSSFDESERRAVQTTSMTVREGNMGVTATVSFVDERTEHNQTTASLTAFAHEGSTAEAIIPRTSASL